jgi:hypothetical protein
LVTPPTAVATPDAPIDRVRGLKERLWRLEGSIIVPVSVAKISPPGWERDPIRSITRPEIAQRRAAQSTPRTTAMLRFSLNGAGEVGTAGLPWTQSEDERSPASNDIKGSTSWFRS